MKRFLFMFIMASTPVSASEMDGRWFLDDSGVKTCAPDYVMDDRPLVISGRTWTFYESTCDTKLAGDRLTLMCRGEGKTRRSVEKVRFAGNKMTRTVDGFTFHYTRCPEQN